MAFIVQKRYEKRYEKGRSKWKLVAVTHMGCSSIELILSHNCSIGLPSSCFWLQKEEKQKVKETYAFMYATRILAFKSSKHTKHGREL